MGNENSKKKDPGEQLFDAAFEMKQQSKMLEKEAAKIRQNEAKERTKIVNVRNQMLCQNVIAQELKKGNMEFAKLYAENAIRLKKEGLNVQRFSAKLGAVASKLEGAYRTQQVLKIIYICFMVANDLDFLTN